jgi:hypothetical protein
LALKAVSWSPVPVWAPSSISYTYILPHLLPDPLHSSPQAILSPKGGFLGMVGERGIGGSKCGSTAAVAIIYKNKVRGAFGLGQRPSFCVCVVCVRIRPTRRVSVPPSVFFRTVSA